MGVGQRERQDDPLHLGVATTVNKAGLIATITSGSPTGQVSNGDTNPINFVVRDAAATRARGLHLRLGNGGIYG